jgi:hypothetical protein
MSIGLIDILRVGRAEYQVLSDYWALQRPMLDLMRRWV